MQSDGTIVTKNSYWWEEFRAYLICMQHGNFHTCHRPTLLLLCTTAHEHHSKPGSDTHKICINTYVHKTYAHTCVATVIHTRTHNIADIILTPDVEDSHTCSTPHSLLPLHQHQSHCSQDWVEDTTHNTTNKTVWLLRHILQLSVYITWHTLRT